MTDHIHRNWKEWAVEYGAMHRASQSGTSGASEELEHLEAELEAELRSDPLAFGVRKGIDLAAAAADAATTEDSDVALSVLRARTAARFESCSDLLDAIDLPDREWIVDNGWLPANRVGMLAGRGGTGKSRLALQLACAVAAGQKAWLGNPASIHTAKLGDRPGQIGIQPSPVVFASWEDELHDAMRRCQSMAEALPWLTREAIRDRVHWIDASPHGPLWGPSDAGSRHVSTSAEITQAGRSIRDFCVSVKARLLILDPLAAVYASDENVRGLVRHFVTSWDAWARQALCAVMMIAHPPKSEATFSGSTDWENASRWMWTLDRQPTGWFLDTDGRDSKIQSKNSTPITAPMLE